MSKEKKAILKAEEAIKFLDPGHSKEHRAFLQKYLNTKMQVLGLSAKDIHALCKPGAVFGKQPFENEMNLWNEVYPLAKYHETRSLPLLFAKKQHKKYDPEFLWNITKAWVNHIDNWAHSDTLSSIYSHLLENIEDKIYPQLQKWNSSKNPWERRQSVVSLLLYARTRKKFLKPEKYISLIEPLLSDEDYYVQKGVGWTLRELGVVYPKEQKAFINKHLADISATAFTAAVEKWDKAEKEKLKILRKKLKSGKK